MVGPPILLYRSSRAGSLGSPSTENVAQRVLTISYLGSKWEVGSDFELLFHKNRELVANIGRVSIYCSPQSARRGVGR